MRLSADQKSKEKKLIDDKNVAKKNLQSTALYGVQHHKKENREVKETGKRKLEEVTSDDKTSSSFDKDQKRNSSVGVSVERLTEIRNIWQKSFDKHQETMQHFDANLEETKGLRQDIKYLTEVMLDIKDLLSSK